MVKYNQSKQSLDLMIKFPSLIQAGVPTPVSLVGSIDLSQLDHQEALRLAKVAKLLSGFMNGHNVNEHENKEIEGKEVSMPSGLDKVNVLLQISEVGNVTSDEDKGTSTD